MNIPPSVYDRFSSPFTMGSIGAKAELIEFNKKFAEEHRNKAAHLYFSGEVML